MRSCVLLCVLLLLSSHGVNPVKIQVGKFTFMLESVLKLKDLLQEEWEDINEAANEACDSPKLPEEYHSVCAEADAPVIFVQLINAAMDECEICANPACPGCL